VLTLRPFDRSDFARLVAWAESAEFLMQWAGPIFTYPLDEAQLERYRLLATGDPPTRLIFTVLAAPAGEAVGHIELSNIDRRNRSASVSRVLIAPGRRGQGLGQQMVAQVLEIAFGQLGLHRVDLFVFDFNQSAIACYERAGFVREGRLRDVRQMPGGFWSLIQMSLLEHEWAARQSPPDAPRQSR
jgi:RimJ/RimL family protein N-acetyltransferase